MRRTAVAIGLQLLIVTLFRPLGVGQSQQSISDPAAILLAQQASVALTGGSRVVDVTLQANVMSITGSENDTGSGTFQARTMSDTRISLLMSKETRTEVRATRNGIAMGAWQRNSEPVNSFAHHNCLTEGVWFFPALSWLGQTSDQSLIFKFVGIEQRNGISVEHLEISRTATGKFGELLERLSRTDYYLDPNTKLPVAIAFRVHPDMDSGTDIPFEVRLDHYRSVDGIQVPFHFEQVLNGTSTVDVTVTNVSLNSGLSDSLFNLQ